MILKIATRVYDHTAVLILALDTTTRGGSVAVTEDDRLLALVEGDSTRTHGERMPSEIAATLRTAGVGHRDLQLLAVASGPGAFTGLRIGLAAIQGLALVTGTPVVGVSALDALAWMAWRECETVTTTTIAACMDAQRGEVFYAIYPPQSLEGHAVPEAMAEPAVGLPEIMLPEIARLASEVVLIGDGALHHRAVIEQYARGQWKVLETTPPLAPAVARLGRRRAARGEAGAPHALRPLYVRRPDAELERERRTKS